VSGQKPVLDSTRCLFGAFGALASQGGNGYQQQSLTYREGQLERTFDIAQHFHPWQDSTLLTLTQEREDVSAGRIPMIAWAGPTTPSGGVLAAIISGTHDVWITSVAAALKAFGAPVILRPMWEMNGDWYAWSGPSNGSDPTLYVSMWQHLWQLFQQAGATNVGFDWSPNSSSTPGGVNTADANSWRAYYPGDQYVDYLGASIYNAVDLAGSTWSGIRTYGDPIAQDWLAGMGGLTSGTKPMMASEWGCYLGTGSATGNKPQWVTNASGFFRSRGFAAVCYFDTDVSGSGIPWAMDSSAASLMAFTQMSADPWFNGHGIGGSGHRPKVLALSPLHYWRFDGLTGTYPDLGSLNVAGTVVGNIMRGAGSIAPGLGGAATTGGGAYVTTGTTLGTALSAGFTVECLVQLGAVSSATAQGAVMATLNAGTTTALGIYANTSRTLTNVAGSTTFYYRNEAGSARAMDITTDVYDGLWHHLVWVCDPTALTDTVYVDGAAVTPNTSTGAANTGASAAFGFPLALLARNLRGTLDQVPVASLDEVAVYPTKLTSGQVNTLFASLTA
jgi:hypothetical protein